MCTKHLHFVAYLGKGSMFPKSVDKFHWFDNYLEAKKKSKTYSFVDTKYIIELMLNHFDYIVNPNDSSLHFHYDVRHNLDFYKNFIEEVYEDNKLRLDISMFGWSYKNKK